MNDAIERYLSGIMDKDEEVWLMSEIDGNPELGKELELRRKTNKVLSDMSVIELRSKLETIEMSRRAINPVRRATIKAAKVAAVIAGVAVISSSIYFPARSVSPTRLYDKHFNRYEAISYTRSANATTNALFASAMESIRAKNYDQAISYLEQVIYSDEANIESIFMLGVANMEIKNYKNAEEQFAKVINENNNLFIEDASWYLGLCYMVSNEKNKALKQFEFIASTKSKYNKEAKKLARKLD